MFSSSVFADFSFDVDFRVGLEVDFSGTFVVALVFAGFEVVFLEVVEVNAAVFVVLVFCPSKIR